MLTVSFSANRRLVQSVVSLTSRQVFPGTCSKRPFVVETQFRPVTLTDRCKYLTAKRQLNSQVLRPYVDPKLSYAFGRSQENLVYSTIIRELDQQVARSPNEIAVIIHSEGIKKTLHELKHDINKVSKALVRKFGITKGDVVGIFAYNCYNWILVQYACSQIGAVLTPINPSYKADELAYVLKKGKVKCLFMPGPRSIQRELNDHLAVIQSKVVVDLSREGTDNFRLENIIFLDGENEYTHDEIQNKLNCQFSSWSSTQENDGIVYRSEQEADDAKCAPSEACIIDPYSISPDDLFAVYYTSGTTGKPKGACLTHNTVVNNVRFCQIRVRNGRPRNWKLIIATTLPLFHIFAGVLNTISLAVGNTTVIYSGHKYDIRTYVESIIEHQANTTTLTPTILIDMLTYIEQNNLANDIPLKLIQPGGAALPAELVSRAFKLLPHLEEVRTGYGSTENGAVASLQTIHEPESSRAHTVGPPLDFCEIRIAKQMAHGDDSSNDLEACVPLGEYGEIQTRGYNTMIEYLDQQDKTRDVITKNRWYKTGDIGIMFPSGSIQVTGRSKNMIIKGGENIYPEEVEQMLHKMEGVEKVHVVGVPDERFGEQVCAWIKLKPTYKEIKGDYDPISKDPKAIHREDVLKFCRDNMTYFKVPKYLLFVDDFPMTPTKKVQSHLVIERSIEILGLKKS